MQFIAAGPPPGKDGFADLKDVTAVVRTVDQYTNDYKVVLNKATVPMGTAYHVHLLTAGIVH